MTILALSIPAPPQYLFIGGPEDGRMHAIDGEPPPPVICVPVPQPLVWEAADLPPQAIIIPETIHYRRLAVQSVMGQGSVRYGYVYSCLSLSPAPPPSPVSADAWRSGGRVAAPRRKGMWRNDRHP